MSQIFDENNTKSSGTWKLLEKYLYVVLFGYICNRCSFVNFFLGFKRILKPGKFLYSVVFHGNSDYVFFSGSRFHKGFFQPLETFSLCVLIFDLSRLVFGSWILDSFIIFGKFFFFFFFLQVWKELCFCSKDI